MKIAVFCVGNRLMLDDGIGPAVYDELVEHYEIPEGVDPLRSGLHDHEATEQSGRIRLHHHGRCG